VEQIYYEDVRVGDSLPTLVKHPTPRQLVMWACAAGEFSEMHYDKEFALNKGFPGIIVHGMLMVSFLGQMVTDWIGDWGTLKKIKTSNRQFILVDEDITCRGSITKRYMEDGEHRVELELWAEDGKGEKCILGVAQVTLPQCANASDS